MFWLNEVRPSGMSVDQRSALSTMVPAGGESPPDFTPYDAEFFIASSGNVVSHDPHLNQDGEALYRFLLSQATTPPTVLLRCSGTHQQSRTRTVTRTGHNGRIETTTEHYTETITDFDFLIDISQYIVQGPVHWSVADAEPAYRGLMVRQIDHLANARRKATRRENNAFDSWKRHRTARGLPPWVESESGVNDDISLRSSRTLRQWADDYCQSTKHLKEFVYKKVIHGWDFAYMENAIRSIIHESDTSYRGFVYVGFEVSAAKIYIRPDNTLSRLLSNSCLFSLSIILLIYPFIWLFKRFHSHGGGRWKVCGGAYALKHYGPVPTRSSPATLSPYLVETSNGQGSSTSPAVAAIPPRLIETQDGVQQLIGLHEDEWLQQWEHTIGRAVQSRYISNTPIYQPHFASG